MSINNHTANIPVEDAAYRQMMGLFEEAPLRERFSRTLRGLNAPYDSGDHKYAVLQIQRLAAPVLALLLTAMLISLLLAIQQRGTAPPPGRIVAISEPLNDPPPDFAPIPEPPTEPTTINPTTFVGVNAAPVDMPLAPLPQPPTPRPPQTPGADKRVVKAINIGGVLVLTTQPQRTGKGREELGKKYGIPPEVEESVMRGLRWLKARQLGDGSWPGQKTAMTGLALLTFLAHGEVPGDTSPEFGQTVEKGLRFLISSQGEDGLFEHKDGNNYSHPIAAYALCEAYSMTKNPLLKEPAEKAVAHIVKGQHESGGWDYKMNPATDRDDTSYMGWCAQALKAAEIAEPVGLEVDGLDEACAKAVRGFRKNSHPQGGFGYTAPARGGLSGVGALCMQLLGAAAAPEVAAAMRFLEPASFSFESWEEQPYSGSSPVYYWYYITQAKFQQGGSDWEKWMPKFTSELVRRQVVEKDSVADHEGKMQDAGYWDSPSKGESHSTGGRPVKAIVYSGGVKGEDAEQLGGRIQDTCLCTLQLLVYSRYLPTFVKIEVEEAPPTVIAEKDVPVTVVW